MDTFSEFYGLQNFNWNFPVPAFTLCWLVENILPSFGIAISLINSGVKLKILERCTVTQMTKLDQNEENPIKGDEKNSKTQGETIKEDKH